MTFENGQRKKAKTESPTIIVLASIYDGAAGYCDGSDDMVRDGERSGSCMEKDCIHHAS